MITNKSTHKEVEFLIIESPFESLNISFISIHLLFAIHSSLSIRPESIKVQTQA